MSGLNVAHRRRHCAGHGFTDANVDALVSCYNKSPLSLRSLFDADGQRFSEIGTLLDDFAGRNDGVSNFARPARSLLDLCRSLGDRAARIPRDAFHR
ncbi:MAG: hypothetical protein JO349_01915 [Candidatus Eremiobacteraeota bacterium]|nr:hypothetical protein [Candidatus Eremiobacteraeota bacterium]